MLQQHSESLGLLETRSAELEGASLRRFHRMLPLHRLGDRLVLHTIDQSGSSAVKPVEPVELCGIVSTAALHSSPYQQLCSSANDAAAQQGSHALLDLVPPALCAIMSQ